MPIEQLKKLPAKARELWESTFQANKKEYGAEKAAQIAWAAVKNKYKKVSGRWLVKNMLLKLKLIKSGLFFPSYKFHVELSNDQWDDDGQRVDPALLEKLVVEDKVERIGDVDHENIAREENRMEERRQYLCTEEGTDGLYYLEKVHYQDGKVIGLIGMNKKHKHYNTFLEKHKKGKYLSASAEFDNYKLGEDGKTIVQADKLGWTITDHPINQSAGVKNIYAE